MLLVKVCRALHWRMLMMSQVCSLSGARRCVLLWTRGQSVSQKITVPQGQTVATAVFITHRKASLTGPRQNRRESLRWCGGLLSSRSNRSLHNKQTNKLYKQPWSVVFSSALIRWLHLNIILGTNKYLFNGQLAHLQCLAFICHSFEYISDIYLEHFYGMKLQSSLEYSMLFKVLCGCLHSLSMSK